MPTLTIQLPGLPPVAHVLKDETITVGRMKGNTIVIDDVSVSLSHAKITRKSGEYFLKDLNSTNGTIVNGQPIVEVKLQNRDQVRFADISGQFLADAPEAVTAVPASPAVAQAKVAPVPAVPVVAPKPAAPRRAPAFSFARLLNKVVPFIGAAAALAVFSVIGWKMVHVSQSGADGGAKSNTAASSTAAEPAETRRRVDMTVPAQVVEPSTPAQSADTAAAAGNDVAQWVSALKSDDPVERRRAATALHSLGPEAREAVPALRQALDDTDAQVRMWAAVTLVNDKCYDKATIPILLGVLREDNPVLRQVACLSLGLIPYEETEKETVVPILTETAGKDTSEDVRKAAVTALNIIAPDALAKAGLRGNP